LFRRLKLVDTIRVPPKSLDEDVETVVKGMLEQKLEGKIDRDLGMFVAVTDIIDIHEGKLIAGDAGIYHNVEFECISYRPYMQEIVEGEVVEVVNFGAFVGLGPMDALLHISQITDDYVSHDQKNARLVGKETDFALDEGDFVRARVVAVSLSEQNPQDSKVGLTMRQPTLKKLGDEELGKFEEAKVEIMEAKDVEEADKEDEEASVDKVVCSECGEEYKAITASHLKTHDMDMEEYKEKYPNASTRPGD